MKNKIVIFKVLAAIIAVGGAFASVSANSSAVLTSAYVRYTTATHVIKCTRVGDCDISGTAACVVNVVIGGVTTPNVPALVTLPPNNNTCQTAIAGTNVAGATIPPKTLPTGAKLH